MARVPLLALIPPVVFAGMAGLFLGGMFRENPDALPSAQEGFPAPQIVELPVGDLPSFDMADLGEGPLVVNFWASWCAPCRVEHPYLIALAEDDVPVFGVNRDRTAEQAKAFLDELGNPFQAVVADPKNRQSIEWGVYALPETFVVDVNGQVVLHVRGPINDAILDNRIRPALAAATASAE